jgi:crotonobetainyl-CoA:carnitine CoA-transferase CaiB-like acyl-CoA transferase
VAGRLGSPRPAGRRQRSQARRGLGAVAGSAGAHQMWSCRRYSRSQAATSAATTPRSTGCFHCRSWAQLHQPQQPWQQWRNSSSDADAASAASSVKDTRRQAPLHGVRVLEMGQLIAGPFTGTILAYFGAEVIKIEAPGSGDALRGWRELDETGTSWWTRSMMRNKKCVTVNLRDARGQALAKQLALSSDVLIENFRPGTMEQWGMGPEDFQNDHPSLVFTRISGYGQTGPYASRPGYASACEGFGGFRYINGHQGQAPVRPNISLGDTLAALHAVIGTLLALLERGKASALKSQGVGDGGGGGGTGQVVDVAICACVWQCLYCRSL